MTVHSKDTIWQIRVRKQLDELVAKAVAKETHSTKSEFIRQAVREKLEKIGVLVYDRKEQTEA